MQLGLTVTFSVPPPLRKSCPDGGIGRRAGLKHQCRKACRFDPGSGYLFYSPPPVPHMGEVVLRAHYHTGLRFAVLRTALVRLVFFSLPSPTWGKSCYMRLGELKNSRNHKQNL